MPTPAEYAYCARLGMRQCEAARHLGVSTVAVCRAAARHGLAFGRIGLDFTRGRQLAMRFYAYPWDDMDVGDWFDAYANAHSVARRGTAARPGKAFAGITRAHVNRVVRVA